MKDYKTEHIINLGLVGHASSGKTCLAESMSLVAKTINKSGTIESGTTLSDYRKHEIDHQHSISMSVLNFEFLDKKVNVIDTPGYMDFIGDVKSGMRVVDTSAIVINAAEGIEVLTELCWEYSEEYKNAKCFIVNMCDKDLSKFDSVLNNLKERFGRNIFPFMMPVNEGDGFNQISDVLKKEILEFDSNGNYTSKAGSDDLQSLYEELIEMVAESDEKLLETFFENGELTDDELKGGLTAAISNGLVPVFCCAGNKNIGTKRILEILSRYGITAADRFFTANQGDEKINVSYNDNHLSAMVFKTLSEEHVGELSFFRVFSGQLKPGDDIENVSRNSHEKLRQIYFMHGKNRKDASSIIAGDIGAALKLKGTHSGDTLTSASRKVKFEEIVYPSPNMSYAITPSSRGDEDKMATGLSVSHEEDPTFIYGFDKETKETIIKGQGDLHLNIVLDKIKDRFGVSLDKNKPKVPYRETIKANSDSKYRHKKQSGGSGQFAEVWLRIAPVQRGEGIDFSNSLVGQNVDRTFVSSVEKGINQICDDGIIAGCKVVDVKIDFYDGKMHPVDSNDMAFQIAGKHAFFDAFKTANPILLEPIYKIRVKVPEDVMGDVMGDISQRRGKVGGMDTEGSFQIINAEIPLENLHDYATALKSMSSGRGMFSQEFSHYEDMPHNEAGRIIKAYESSRAAGE